MQITNEMLSNGKGGDSIEGLILVKDRSVQKTKSGGEYISGSLQSQKKMNYKIWSTSPAFELFKNEEIVNEVCEIKGKFDDYNGIISINISEAEIKRGEDIGPFIEGKYNGDALLISLQEFCKHNLSDKGNDLVKEIFFSDTLMMNRFKVEFAAMSHHDNCKSGLIAHTCKVLDLLKKTISIYKNITADENGVPDPDKKDLLYIGALMHDIGKIDEMKYGTYIEGSFVTHRIIGLEFILKHKDRFLIDYSPMWFKHLEAIIMQHHDDYGEPCKTIYSYVIHQIDELESTMSLMNQLIPDAADTPAGKTIKLHDYRLNF